MKKCHRKVFNQFLSKSHVSVSDLITLIFFFFHVQNPEKQLLQEQTSLLFINRTVRSFMETPAGNNQRQLTQHGSLSHTAVCMDPLTPSCCHKHSLKHQMLINPPLKIVLHKHTVSSQLIEETIELLNIDEKRSQTGLKRVVVFLSFCFGH